MNFLIDCVEERNAMPLFLPKRRYSSAAMRRFSLAAYEEISLFASAFQPQNKTIGKSVQATVVSYQIESFSSK